MLVSAINAYRSVPHVDASKELRSLGLPTAEKFLVLWQDIVAGKVDHWAFAPYHLFGGISIYKVESYGRFAIYAVLDEPDDGITVTVMLAARRGDATIGKAVWDGSMDTLRHTILQPRLADCFHPQRRQHP